jgi:hypothetical protein
LHESPLVIIADFRQKIKFGGILREKFKTEIRKGHRRQSEAGLRLRRASTLAHGHVKRGLRGTQAPRDSGKQECLRQLLRAVYVVFKVGIAVWRNLIMKVGIRCAQSLGGFPLVGDAVL